MLSGIILCLVLKFSLHFGINEPVECQVTSGESEVPTRFIPRYSSLFGQDDCQCGHFTEHKKDSQDLEAECTSFPMRELICFCSLFFFHYKDKIFQLVYSIVPSSFTNKNQRWSFSEDKNGF